ncbi:LysR family transcriptional regulator [Brevibacillus sp. TJ4]|uniref:LysR family transcriptional regulator n=1 Tax=Brevibacillus sp. TJ4 TaxID=3234853 RepID=UPI0037D7EC9B
MNIANLEAFVYVVHFHSFHKAAEALFLSQPSITARIQSLERELDTKLFERDGRGFALTENGKQFLPYAQQVLQTYKRGQQQLKKMITRDDELRIGCTVSASSYLVPEILPMVAETFPGLHVKIVTSSSEAIIEKVLDKEIDIGFIRNLYHPAIHSVKFLEDPIRLFVYEGHPLAQSGEIEIEAVRDEPFVFFECGSFDWMRIHLLFESLDHPPNIAYQVDNLETAKKLLLNKMAIAFLPSFCVREETLQGRLLPLRVPAIANLFLRTNLVSPKGGSVWHNAFQSLAHKVQHMMMTGTGS